MYTRKVLAPDYSFTSPDAMLLLALRDLNQYDRHTPDYYINPPSRGPKHRKKLAKVNPRKKHSNQRYWR